MSRSVEAFVNAAVKLSDLKVTQKNFLRYMNVTLRPDQCIAQMLGLMPPDIKAAMSGLVDTGMVFNAEWNERAHQGMLGVFQAATAVDTAHVYFNDQISCPLSKMQLVNNIYNIKNSFLYDPLTDTHHMMDFEFIKLRLKALLGDDYGKWMGTNSIDCELYYSPDNPSRIIPMPGEQRQRFNTWTAAPWTLGWTPKKGVDMPKDFLEFVTLLVPNHDDHNCVMAWLRDAIFERAEPILVMTGIPGIGKNILIENIARALVGNANYRTASRGFNKTQFHNNVSHCRLFFLDEMTLSHEARETLKSYHNGIASIERKGKDIHDPEPLHASFALANNNYQYIKLEYSDRKFFTPELTTIPLLLTMGQRKIDGLIENLTKPEYLQDLASSLYFKFPPQASSDFPKNDLYKKICIHSYSNPFKKFILTAMTQPVISAKQFNRNSRHQIDAMELQEWCDQYQAQFREVLAEITVDDGGRWTATSKVFKSATNLVPITKK